MVGYICLIAMFVFFLTSGCGEAIIEEKPPVREDEHQGMADTIEDDYLVKYNYRDGKSVTRYNLGWQTFETPDHYCISDDGVNGGADIECWEKTPE
jgi:hypothetical protein